MAQLLTAGDVRNTEAAYYDVIRAKTAALFQAACRIGAVDADRPAIEEEALATLRRRARHRLPARRRRARLLRPRGAARKTVGDDFREGKASLPVLLAYAGAARTSGPSGSVIGEPAAQCQGDLAEAQRLLARHGTLDATLAQARARASGHAPASRCSTPRPGGRPRRESSISPSPAPIDAADTACAPQRFRLSLAAALGV